MKSITVKGGIRVTETVAPSELGQLVRSGSVTRENEFKMAYASLPELPEHLRKCGSSMSTAERREYSEYSHKLDKAILKLVSKQLTDKVLADDWDMMRGANYQHSDFIKSHVPAIKLENAVRYFSNLVLKSSRKDDGHFQNVPACSFEFEDRTISIRFGDGIKEPVGYRPYSNRGNSAGPVISVDEKEIVFDTSLSARIGRTKLIEAVRGRFIKKNDAFLSRLADKILAFTHGDLQ